jgi:hypothetical protein
MKNGFLILNDKDWEKATPEQRDWWIFNTLQAIDGRTKKLEQAQMSMEGIPERVGKLEKWSLVKALCVSASAFAGGAIMVLILVIFKIKVGP